MIGRSWITFSLFSSYIITSCFRFILFNIIIYDSSYFLHNTYIVLCSIKVSFLFTLTSVFKFVNTNYCVYKILMVPDTLRCTNTIFLVRINNFLSKINTLFFYYKHLFRIPADIFLCHLHHAFSTIQHFL